MDSSLHSQMSTLTDNTTIAQAQTSSTNHPNPTEITLKVIRGRHCCAVQDTATARETVDF